LKLFNLDKVEKYLVPTDFYRVMLCLAQTMHGKMSVRLSITCHYSVEIAKYIDLSIPLGSHTIIVFLYQTLW